MLPVWWPKVDVDLRPSAGWLRIGAQQISLQDIKARMHAADLAARVQRSDTDGEKRSRYLSSEPDVIIADTAPLPRSDVSREGLNTDSTIS